MNKIYNVIMLGITGSGKSQLCNFLLNDPTNSKHKVGENIFSQTQMEDVIKQDEKNLIAEKKYHFIDSCGGDDSDNNDLQNLEEYTKFLQKKGEVNCIIYVFNYEAKVSDSIKEYLKKLSLIFTKIEFYDHLIIILTHYPQKAKSKDKAKMKNYKKQINKFMKEAFEIKDDKIKKDIFFIDTDPDEDDELNKFYNENQIKQRDAIYKEIESICRKQEEKLLFPITKFTFNQEDLDKKILDEKEIIQKKINQWKENPEIYKQDMEKYDQDKKLNNIRLEGYKQNNINRTYDEPSDGLCWFGQIVVGLFEFFDDCCHIF